MATTPISQSLSNPSPSANQGYLMNLSLGGTDYKIYAYFQDSNGVKTYLPTTLDSQNLEKIRNLTWGLFNAHDCRRKSLNEAPYEIKTLDARGLIKSDNSIVSHDFNIAPISPPFFTNQMVDSLSRAGRPIQASAIKAQDIWNTLEEVLRREAGQNHSPNPARMDTATTNPISQPPISNSSPPPISTLTPPQPSNPNPVQQPPPTYRPPLNSVDLDLRDLDYNQQNWYDQIPAPQKLRIINDILAFRTPGGGIYERVWNRFAQLATPSVSTLQLMEQEKTRLVRTLLHAPSQIPREIRSQANQIIESFHRSLPQSQLRDLVEALIRQEFERKQELFQRIREQAIAEGTVIEGWDRDWAQHHYLDDDRRFIQALAGWLDNN